MVVLVGVDVDEQDLSLVVLSDRGSGLLLGGVLVGLNERKEHKGNIRLGSFEYSSA